MKNGRSGVFGMLIFLVIACSSEPAPRWCGNGDLNAGEDCDGEIYRASAPYTCERLGYNSPGRAGCTPDCRIDPAPCLDSGMCGDGWMTPGWEECDGKDNGQETCVSLGHHAGSLYCLEDCRFDISRCLRCGDGVVQAQYGELMESGERYCLDAGHLGGVLQTDDCVTPSGDHCGEYALAKPAGSLSRPMVALREDGTIFYAGRATAAFDGFTHSMPGCPRLDMIMDPLVNPPQTIGYKHDPECEMEFFAARPAGELEEVRVQRAMDGRIEQIMDLGEVGVAVLRQHLEALTLEVMDPFGATVHSVPLPIGASGNRPTIRRLGADRTGLSVVAADGLRLWALDHQSGRLDELLFLPQVRFAGVTYTFSERFDHQIAWMGEDQWLVYVALYTQGSSELFALHIRLVDGAPKVVRFQPLIGDIGHLEADADAGEATFVFTATAKHPKVTKNVFSLTGEALATFRLDLPDGFIPEKLVSDGGGGSLLFGLLPVEGNVDPVGQPCRIP